MVGKMGLLGGVHFCPKGPFTDAPLPHLQCKRQGAIKDNKVIERLRRWEGPNLVMFTKAMPWEPDKSHPRTLLASDEEEKDLTGNLLFV
ncbi:unnamed protein product [Dovyalis caffra]|uniref:Uncharacterized protein n=1 Tax=Dovyalis caffra TaxID=77055 RepID=A0AAV1QTE9_9ROSI|nr:unnamed protein product [Dovyalis caffra]